MSVNSNPWMGEALRIYFALRNMPATAAVEILAASLASAEMQGELKGTVDAIEVVRNSGAPVLN